MKKAKGKDNYRKLVKELQDIQEIYPDGRKYAEKLAATWKESFPQKPAMLEEIEKSGF